MKISVWHIWVNTGLVYSIGFDSVPPCGHARTDSYYVSAKGGQRG